MKIMDSSPSIVKETFLFLTKLAWNSRITLPFLVTAAFMAMDFRMQLEINVHTERIMVQDEPLELIDNGDQDSSWETITVDSNSDDDYLDSDDLDS